MTAPNFKLVFTVILLTLCLQTKCDTDGIDGSHRNNYMITDLTGKDDAAFALEVDDWSSTSTNIINPDLYGTYGVSPATPVFIMGGPTVLKTYGGFDRTYINLPPHNIIYFSMTVYMIGNWHYDSSFQIFFGKKSFTLGLFLMDYVTDFSTSALNTGLKDLPAIRVYGKARHRTSPLDFRVQLSTLDGEEKSLGFRDITLLFRTYTEENPENNQMCGITEVPLQLNQCPCFESMYQDSNGLCKACDPLCKTCLGPATSQCLSCADNAYFDGEKCAECDPSCATCNGGTDTDCIKCNAGDFLLHKNACISSCTSPFQLSSIPGECDDPCYATDEYLYADPPPYHCAADCPSTYNGYVYHGTKLCSRFCPGVLYYEPPVDPSLTGVCLPSCKSGYNTDTDARYCTPCQDSLCMTCATDPAVCQECQNGAILDTNGVCKVCTNLQVTFLKTTDTSYQYQFQLFPSSCSLSAQTVKNYLIGTQDSINDFPPYNFQITSTAANEYLAVLTFSSSITETSEFNVMLKYLTASLSVPQKILPSPGLQELGEVAPALGSVVAGAMGASLLGTLLIGASGALWSLLSLAQFIGYFMYMNIEYPLQMNLFFEILGFTSWDFMPNPLEKMTEDMAGDVLDDNDPRYLPPQKFIDNEVNAFFIENAAGIILVNMGLLFILWVLIKMQKSEKFQRNRLVKYLKDTLMWNAIMRTFLENSAPLMLGVFLQFRVFYFTKAYLVFCVLLALFSFFYFGAMIYFIVRTLHERTNNELQKEKVVETIGTLYEGLELTHKESKYYNLIILFRSVLLMFVISIFDSIPILQISALIPVNAGLIYFLYFKSAFEDKYLTKVNKIKECFILAAEIFILLLTFQGCSEAFYNVIGWFSVALLCTALLVELVYVLYIQIKEIKQIFRKVKNAWAIIVKWIKKQCAESQNKRPRRVIQFHANESRTMEMGLFNTNAQSDISFTNHLEESKENTRDRILRSTRKEEDFKDDIN